MGNSLEAVVGGAQGAGSEVWMREVLPAILESTPFCRSKQSQELLHYIVRETLAGNGESLKERVIGVEVFGRHADYDTSADPIVRSRATEVRKRLAQYYMGQGAHDQRRIEISPGAYRAIFTTATESIISPGPSNTEIGNSHYTVEPSISPSNPPPRSPEASVAISDPIKKDGFRSGRWPMILVATIVLILAGLSLWMRGRSAIDQFWHPLFAGAKPLLIYTGAVQYGNTFITAGDLSASVNVASLLSRDRQTFDIRTGQDIAFDDLRQFPAVLIGCLNNRWTMLVNDDLHFNCLLNKVPMIRESSGSKREWTSTRSSNGTLEVDYAVVTRLTSSKMGQPLIALAGLTDSGTRAAAEFVTSKKSLAELAKSAPKGWEHKDMQLVLMTKVVNQIPSDTTVVAVRYW